MNKEHFPIIPRLQLYNDLHESGTQTSKTILELAKMEINKTRDISPDSLMSSPSRDCDSLTNFDDDGEVFSEENDRKVQVKQVYKRRQHINRQETPKSKSLIEMFLMKSKQKTEPFGFENRTKFLQQISPLRYISKENSVRTLKSQSYVEPKVQTHRFKVKLVKDFVMETDEIKPVEYFSGENKTESSPRHNASFMCPTISSENKNKLPQVQCISKLISPTRRGRSFSPEQKLSTSESKRKIPYIDQSQQSSVYSKDRDSGFSDNKKSVITKKDEFEVVNPLLKSPPFEEDLLKIDELSLNISSEVIY